MQFACWSLLDTLNSTNGQCNLYPSSPRPDRLWGPPRHLSNWYRGLLQRG